LAGGFKLLPIVIGIARAMRFVPRTCAPDGDALDVLIYSHAGATAPGVVVPARIIGALRVEQKRGRGPVKRNDRVLVVPADEKFHAGNNWPDVFDFHRPNTPYPEVLREAPLP